MPDNIYVQVLAGLMVLLLVLAWMFPGQQWLEPFRAKRMPRPRPTRHDYLSESTPHLPPAPAARAPLTAVEARVEASQHRARRSSGLYAGVSLIGASLLALFAGSTLSSITGLGDAGDALVWVIAVMLAGAGTFAILAAIRNR